MNILYIMYVSYLVALAGGIHSRVFRFRAGRPLFIYLCIEIASEITSYITVIIYHVNNQFVMHVDSIMDLLMFLSFYRMILKPGTVRNLLPFAAIVGLLIGAADWWLLAGPYVQPSFARTSHLLLIAPLPLVFFQQLLQNPEVEDLRTYPLFWINTAALFKYFGLLAVSSVGYLIHNAEVGSSFRVLWNINNLVNIVFNVLLGIGFYRWKTPVTSYS
ncbi:MAG TPA: hypothetical protein PKX04_07250 [Chitinophagales bacterium]|nr:hypothetical protein [Chitinophagales bacterium]HAE14520.1 hypothetical protein [Bacteroidota bacterium]HAE36027.1 hypothetical protein [Bacteroidota bacterium]HPE97736.1 hypothetical protein [Chitinophagales bacterium]